MPTLAPEIEELLAWDRSLGPLVEGLDPPEQRAVLHGALDAFVERTGMTAPAVRSVDDHEVPVGGGTIRLRVYAPEENGPHGAYFHVHGGGFTLGGVDWAVNHVKCAHICAHAGCVVTTVDYRLAPEFAYPTAVEDCYAALLWLADRARMLGIDPARLAVGGESAGGNLAAALALMARDRNGPELALQLLEVPVADMSAASWTRPSMALFGDGYGLDASAIEAFVDAYLPERADREEAYASPLVARDLGGVAPALVLTAEHDPLRDGGEAYARRLREAGVPTTHRRFEGHTHGSSVLWQSWPPATAWMDEVVAAVRSATG